MQWYAGTSGYSYKEWKGLFYPADIASDAMLSYYAARLSTVEINNTFYRMPKRSVLANWAESVPAHFRFSIKASQRITHQQRLKESAETVTMLARQLEALGDKLGAVLFQLPPNLKFDQERLDKFLALLPKELPSAFEFRHGSWFNDATYDALREHGAALCLSEAGVTEKGAELPLPDQHATTNWAYLRLRKPTYTDDELKVWHARARATNVDRVYAFFKHEDEAGGPPLAARFLELANTPAHMAKPPLRVQPKMRKPAAQAKRG